MEYLLKVQKAIAQTEKAFSHENEYAQSWFEVKEDLEYGISLGSEHAVMQTINYWVDPVIDAAGNLIVDDDGDQAYCERMSEIYKLIEGY